MPCIMARRSDTYDHNLTEVVLFLFSCQATRAAVRRNATAGSRVPLIRFSQRYPNPLSRISRASVAVAQTIDYCACNHSGELVCAYLISCQDRTYISMDMQRGAHLTFTFPPHPSLLLVTTSEHDERTRPYPSRRQYQWCKQGNTEALEPEIPQ